MDPRLFGPKRLLAHLGVVVVFLVCLRLGWWQWDRAEAIGGTAQNLAYALMWPLFGGYAIYMWTRILRMELRGESTTRRSSGPILGRPDDGDPTSRGLVRYTAPDPELAAYNAYLAELNGQAVAKTAARARQKEISRRARH